MTYWNYALLYTGQCTGNVQLIGTDTLCPGETGFYRCNTVDSFQVNWNVNGEGGAFPNDIVGETIEIMTVAVAYLLQRTSAAANGRGDRTSVLIYTHDVNTAFGNIIFRCTGGGTPCVHNTLFIGMLATV